MTYRIYFFQGWPIFFSSRCQWISHRLPSPGPAWKRLGGSGGIDSNVPVLVRGEQDGFYYRGTVKEEIEVSDGCCVVAEGMCNREQSSHTSWVQCSSFWLSWWDWRTDHQASRCLSSPVLVLALGTEPGSASPGAAASSIGAAVLCRHRAINSTGKRVCVLCTHVQLESATDQWLRVFPERLVKALIHWFVSTLNLTQKRAYSFSRTGKYLVSLLIESLLTGKNSQQPPPRSRASVVCNGEGLGHDWTTGLNGFSVPCSLANTAGFVKYTCL